MYNDLLYIYIERERYTDRYLYVGRARERIVHARALDVISCMHNFGVIGPRTLRLSM